MHMMMNEGFFLGHYLSSARIQVDLAKIEVILKIPPPKIEKEVCSFLGKGGYYRHFIENYSKLASLYFHYFQRTWNLYGLTNAKMILHV
jgi:hypothetical protein